MNELAITTLKLLEQKLERLETQAQHTALEISEIKAHLTVVRSALDKEVKNEPAPKVSALLPKMPTGGIAIDLPERLEQKIENQKSVVQEPKKVAKSEKKSPGNRGKRTLSIHPELVRTLVEGYEEYRTGPGNYSQLEVLNKLKTELNLPYSIDTIRRAIFHHSNNKGYEDIPTPQELPMRSDYSKEETVADAKAIKFLLRFNLTQKDIAEMVGCNQHKVSNIHTGLTFGWLNILPEDEEQLKHRFAAQLEEKGALK